MSKQLQNPDSDSRRLSASHDLKKENEMNLRSQMKLMVAMATVAATLTMAASAQAATILSSNFNGVDTSTNDVANGSALNVTWDTVNGIVAPSATLPFSGTDGFFPTANEISVDKNLATEGPWTTTIDLVLAGEVQAIDLTDLSFNWRVTNNSGASSTPSSKTTTWTVEIIGSSSGSLGTAASSGAPGNPTQLRTIGLGAFSLDNSESYTLELTASGTGFGHNASLQDLTLSGDITLVPTPEPGAMTLFVLAIGGLFAWRTRRRTR